jgi:hypothetical protein
MHNERGSVTLTRAVLSRVVTIPAAGTIAMSFAAFIAGPFAGVVAVGVTTMLLLATVVIALCLLAVSAGRARQLDSVRKLRLRLFVILIGSFIVAAIAYQTAFVGWGTGLVAAHGLLGATFIAFGVLSAVSVLAGIRAPRAATPAEVPLR